MSDRLLTVKQVTDRLGVSRSTLHQMRKHHDFPPPIRITAKAIRWKPADIERWEKRRRLSVK